MKILPMQSPKFAEWLQSISQVLDPASKARGAPPIRPVYLPYAKQIEFHEAGAVHRERLFLAGNQLGKTLAGAFEEAAHATGNYPEWWRGRRFDGPTVSWVDGSTGQATPVPLPRPPLRRNRRGRA